MSAGFRLSEYIMPKSEELAGVFLQRKGNPHDIVFFKGPGPRLHHVAFTTPESISILRACDVAGTLGFGTGVERGPGRHGPGHALYVYFRDPDGHRVELFNTHYQMLDIETEPVRWDPADACVLVGDSDRSFSCYADFLGVRLCPGDCFQLPVDRPN